MTHEGKSQDILSEDLDLTEPISGLLRKSTAKAHEAAEHSKGAELLVKGLLDKEEYVRFLMMLCRIYTALENGLQNHQSNPVLKPSYQPEVLARAASISSDISILLNDTNWQYHPINLELISSPPNPLSRYLDRLHDLASTESEVTSDMKDIESKSSLLLSHAYVRYLGDLSGGQYIRRRVAKAYELPDTGEGVRFYIFKNSDGEGSGEAGKADMQRLKEWFRIGMDVGVGDDPVLKEALMTEANLAFQLNQDLFTALREPADSSSDATSTAASTPPSASSTSNSPGSTPSTPVTMLPFGTTEVLLENKGNSRAVMARGGLKYEWLFVPIFLLFVVNMFGSWWRNI